jgi:hypothetical protein
MRLAWNCFFKSGIQTRQSSDYKYYDTDKKAEHSKELPPELNYARQD